MLLFVSMFIIMLYLSYIFYPLFAHQLFLMYSSIISIILILALLFLSSPTCGIVINKFKVLVLVFILLAFSSIISDLLKLIKDSVKNLLNSPSLIKYFKISINYKDSNNNLIKNILNNMIDWFYLN